MTTHTQVFAHRGACRVAPENTLPAFACALEMGVAGIEFDVHRTADGQLVVIHDFTVDKTTDGHGLVAAMKRGQYAVSTPAAISPLPSPVCRSPCWTKCSISSGIAAGSTWRSRASTYANDALHVAVVMRRRNLHDQVCFQLQSDHATQAAPP